MALNPSDYPTAHYPTTEPSSSRHVSGAVPIPNERPGPRHAWRAGSTQEPLPQRHGARPRVDEPAAVPDLAFQPPELARSHGSADSDDSVPPPLHHPAVIPRRLSAALSRGPALLRDDFYRLLHSDFGTMLLRRHVANLGLSAAVFAELLTGEYATVRDGVLLGTGKGIPEDPLAAVVMNFVYDEQEPLAVRDWLAFFARETLALTELPNGTVLSESDFYEQVSLGLMNDGHVEALPQGLLRVLRGKPARYTFTNMSDQALPWSRITTHLRRGERLDESDAVLGGLMLATRLQGRVVGDVGDVVHLLQHHVTRLPMPLRELLAHTHGAVDSLVISHT